MSEVTPHRPGDRVVEVPPPPRWAVRAACSSALSATVGFIPLHAIPTQTSLTCRARTGGRTRLRAGPTGKITSRLEY